MTPGRSMSLLDPARVTHKQTRRGGHCGLQYLAPRHAVGAVATATVERRVEMRCRVPCETDLSHRVRALGRVLFDWFVA